jgi:hypothetical protein
MSGRFVPAFLAPKTSFFALVPETPLFVSGKPQHGNNMRPEVANSLVDPMAWGLRLKFVAGDIAKAWLEKGS